MTVRICLDCPAPISTQSKGRCRPCAAIRASSCRRIRPVPDDFAATAPGHSELDLMAHYDASRRVVRRWRREAGIVVKDPAKPRPVPDDFATAAATMRNPALAERYGVSKKTIYRWRIAAGVEAPAEKAPVRTTQGPGRAPVQRKCTRHVTDMLVIKQNSMVVQQQTRNIRVPPPDRSSAEARAAEVLRRLVQTYRCDEAGRMNPRGQFWRHGNVVLTPDEMMRRAERHGWREAA